MPRTLRFGNVEFPNWLKEELNKRSPSPDFNTLFELVLEDYIKRNRPPGVDLTVDEYVARYAIKKHPNGKISFHNHDKDEWEEETPETRAAWERLQHSWLGKVQV